MKSKRTAGISTSCKDESVSEQNYDNATLASYTTRARRGVSIIRERMGGMMSIHKTTKQDSEQDSTEGELDGVIERQRGDSPNIYRRNASCRSSSPDSVSGISTFSSKGS